MSIPCEGYEYRRKLDGLSIPLKCKKGAIVEVEPIFLNPRFLTVKIKYLCGDCWRFFKGV